MEARGWISQGSGLGFRPTGHPESRIGRIGPRGFSVPERGQPARRIENTVPDEAANDLVAVDVAGKCLNDDRGPRHLDQLPGLLVQPPMDHDVVDLHHTQNASGLGNQLVEPLILQRNGTPVRASPRTVPHDLGSNTFIMREHEPHLLLPLDQPADENRIVPVQDLVEILLDCRSHKHRGNSWELP